MATRLRPILRKVAVVFALASALPAISSGVGEAETNPQATRGEDAPVELLPSEAGSADWAQVSAGDEHTCALKTTGRLYCWGYDYHGQLGNGGDNTDEPTPVEVAGGATDWAEVSAGQYQTCARKISGRLYCWGSGVGMAVSTPIEVAGGGTDWAEVSAGGTHTCAHKTSGRLYCWGYDYQGQLGNGGDNTDEPTPVEVAGGATDWAEVSAGFEHTCARKTSGRLYCWGNDYAGELGIGGGDTEQSAPVEVAGGAADWAEVFAGSALTCARKTSGRLYCWGQDDNGELGDGGGNIDQNTPVEVAGGAADWVEVVAGSNHTCARKTSGRLYCWGTNFNGQLGTGGANGTQATPVQVAGGRTDWAEVSAGHAHTCATRTSGRVYCWGTNYRGQLGNPINGVQFTPVEVMGSVGSGSMRVAVLGDSYISGEGAADSGNPYDPGTDRIWPAPNRNECHRTSESWGYQTAVRLGASSDDILFAACSGATTVDVVDFAQWPDSLPGVHGGQTQEETLDDWVQSDPVDVVILSIGGNDAAFGDRVSACLLGPCYWSNSQQQSIITRVRDLRQRLTTTYGFVLRKARQNNPDAELWVANYPVPVSGAYCGALGRADSIYSWPLRGISTADQEWLTTVFLAGLNDSIAWAANDAGANLLDLSGTDYNHDANGADRRVCESVTPSYFHGLKPGWNGNPILVANESFHPTAEGHRHIAAEVWDNYGTEIGTPTETAAHQSQRSPAEAGEPWRWPALRVGPDAAAIELGTVNVTYNPGDTVHVRVEHAPPSTALRLVTYPVPTVLGRVTTDANGTGTGSFVISGSWSPEPHLLRLEAPSTGEPLANAIIDIDPQSPCDVAEGDNDQDGLGDDCDPDPDDGPAADIDHDSVLNHADVCPSIADPAQTDTDGDLVGDACDPDSGGNPTGGYRYPQPDGRIKKGATGTYKGDDRYNTTGLGQTQRGSATPGRSITYYLSAQNDAPVPDRLRVKGTASTSRFRVTYSIGTTDITSAVTAGTYRTPGLAPRASQRIKVTVTVRGTAPAGSSLTGTLTIASDADRTIKDKVKFTTRRT